MMKHMNVGDFDKYVASYLSGASKLTLLLDYDGTLSPLAPHPDLATIPEETKHTLQTLANMSGVFVAVISGRNVDNVKNMVGIDNITYAGSHGLEILNPDGTRFVHPIPSDHQEKVKQLLKTLQKQVCKEGAWVEDKGSILTYHYRQAPEAKQTELAEHTRKLIIAAGFKPVQAHCAIEARPHIEWNKGHASLFILKSAFGEDWCQKTKVIFAGDDVTDEDAMVALKGSSLTFRISSSNSVKTSADHLLSSTDCMLELLKWIETYFSRK